MTVEGPEKKELGEGAIEAILFEAISHPTRIKILFSLEGHAVGFAELKRKLEISSSGNLQHHIIKLATLVCINGDGDYILTDQGRDALVTIRAVRNSQNNQKSQNQGPTDTKTTTFVASLGYYIVQMNMPFVFGDVDPLTPIFALVSALVFAVIFYPMFRYSEARRMNKNTK
ncbi:MAG: winged helix-turn-helix domain-containing protein [Candidatus Thorarchaeota archaeon]